MIDFEKLRALYKFGKEISFSDIQSLIQSAQRQTFQPGQHLIEAGSEKRILFFIHQGLVRVYHVNEKGEEITTSIVQENGPVASQEVIFFQRPARFYYQAMEPTTTLYMDYDVLQNIITTNPKLESSRNKILLEMFRKSSERVNAFVLLTPEERYLQLINENLDLTNRVPDKYIANILGITPVSLSRIRKRIASRG